MWLYGLTARLPLPNEKERKKKNFVDLLYWCREGHNQVRKICLIFLSHCISFHIWIVSAMTQLVADFTPRWHFCQVQSRGCLNLCSCLLDVCSLKNQANFRRSSCLFNAHSHHSIIKSASKHFPVNVTGWRDPSYADLRGNSSKNFQVEA